MLFCTYPGSKAVRSPASHLPNHTSKTNKTCRPVLDEILRRTPTHGRVCRPGKTCLRQLSANTGGNQVDLPGATDERDGWEREREREREGNSVLPARHDDDCERQTGAGQLYAQVVTRLHEVVHRKRLEMRFTGHWHMHNNDNAHVDSSKFV